jgi:uncharacterized protein (DUF3084 family)
MRKPLVIQLELDVDALRRELRAIDADRVDDPAAKKRAEELAEREARIEQRERELEELGQRAVERERALGRRESEMASTPAPRQLPDHERRKLEDDLEVRRARLETEIELRWDEIDRREEDLDEREQRITRKEQELVAYVSQVQDELVRRERRWWEHAGVPRA